MILLDTNVVSQTMHPMGDRAVRKWLDEQDTGSVLLPTPVLAELWFGVEKLPLGKRRLTFEKALNQIELAFRDFMLTLELQDAKTYGRLRALSVRQGRMIGEVDIMIAAIAITHNLTLATRNTRDFEGLGVKLINPFTATP